MMAHTKPQQRKKEKSERLTGEGVKIKFIDLRFERGHQERKKKARRSIDCTFLGRMVICRIVIVD